MTHLGPSLRRTKVRERPALRAGVAALASIALNALAILVLARAGAFTLGVAHEASRVALSPISAERWAANRAVRREGKKPAAAAPFAMPRPLEPPRPEPDKAKGQVVEVAPSKDSTPPKDSRFLSDRDNSVERQTRSKHARAGYGRTLAEPSAPGVRAPPPPGEGGRSDRSAPGAEGKRSEPVSETPPRLARAPGEHGDLASGEAKPHEELAPAPATPGEGQGGERSAGDPASRRLIAPGTLARIAGGPAPDRLDGIEEGEGTYLNTRAWKYATYFNRIKQAVASTWDPLAPLDARDPERTMFGYRDRFTLLGVTLDDGGQVKSLVVEQTCGIDFLDRAAVLAFESAQPFVNPPRGLADGNGEIKFSFGFFVDMGHKGLRLYRAPMPAMP